MLFETSDGILERYFTRDVRRALASAVVQAYDLVSKSDPRLLFGPESQGIGGYLRKAAVAAFISEVITLRKLPFHPYYVHTGPYNQPHLLMMSDDQRVLFSMNQVKRYKGHPKRAKYRDRLIDRNVPNPMFDLFNNEGARSIPESGWTYVMLTHGYGQNRPAFIGLGIPLPHGKWDVIINILGDATADFYVPEETVERKIKPTLKKGVVSERGIKL